MNHFDVIIVGLGPTGSITALLLESYGIKVLGIEKEKEVYNLPRAVTISAVSYTHLTLPTIYSV